MRHRGFSLVELTVGLALAATVMTLLVRVFFDTRTQFQTADAVARLQENARQALQYLSEDVRMAGFLGPMWQYWIIQESTNNQHNIPAVTGECFTAVTQSYRWAVPLSATNVSNTIPPHLYGKHNTNAGFTDCIPNANYVANTDVLSIHYAGAPWTPSGGGMTQTTAVPTAEIGDSDSAFYLRSNFRGGAVFTCANSGMRTGMGGTTNNTCLAQTFGAGGMWPINYPDYPSPPEPLNTPIVKWPDILYDTGALNAAPTPDKAPETGNFVLQSIAYYVRPCTNAGANNTCGDAGDDTTPALVRARLEYDTSKCTPNTDVCVAHEPVAEGVVAFQVQYGIDVPAGSSLYPLGYDDVRYDGQIDRYVTAASIAGGAISSADGVANNQWSHVLTARIWLLIRSTLPELGYVDSNASYDVAGTTVNTQPGYRYQLFTTTLALRNIVPARYDQ